jgi:general L-amino acid transport system substrate-binding protein
MRPLSAFVFVVALISMPFSPVHAQKRAALVIGNGAYSTAPRLPNPRNDAEDVAVALRRNGFETIVGLDLDRTGMDDATIRFARIAREAEVALFYYSGHALQFAGTNYLMPVDAKLSDEADLRRMTRVDEVVADLQQATNVRILVLDSCRDNPLAEDLKRSIGLTRAASLQRGLARIDAPQGMIVAYATQAGRTAADGAARNSPYTAAFLKHIETQEEIGAIFRRISADVYESTKRAQLPELSLSLIGEFYLRGKAIAASAPVVTPGTAEAAQAWAAVRDTTSAAVLDDFIRRYGDTIYGTLAQARLEELKKAQTALLAQPSTSPPPAPPPPALPPPVAPPSPAPLAALAPPASPSPKDASPTLAEVRKRGALRCGVSQGLPGFSAPDANGAWAGLDVDLCRGIAAAVFNDPIKVQFVPLSAKDRFTSLLSGEVDLLARNTAKTEERERNLGLRFGAVNFYDGATFILRKALRVNAATELNGASVCVQLGTTTELRVAEFMRNQHMQYSSVAFQSLDEAVRAYDTGRCDAFVNDRSSLYGLRLKLTSPDDHIILPDLLTNEQLAPVVRQDDARWLDLVTWAHYAMVAAEELDVTQANVDSARQSSSPAVRRLLGQEGPYGAVVGLSNDWAYRVIRHVGNYGEAFERNFGRRSPFKMERGVNGLVAKGGRQQAPALR